MNDERRRTNEGMASDFGFGTPFVIRNSGFVICQSLKAHFFALGVEGFDPGGDEVAGVVVGAAGVHVLVDDAGFVDVDAAADFEIEFAFGDGGHAQAFDDVGTCGDFDTVADAGAGLLLLPEPFGDAQEIGVFTDVLGGAATAEKDADIFLGLDVFEGYVGIDAVAFPLLGDGPAGLDFMEHHLVFPFFRRSDDGCVAAFDEAIEWIEGVNGFSGVADDDEDFGL